MNSFDARYTLSRLNEVLKVLSKPFENLEHTVGILDSKASAILISGTNPLHFASLEVCVKSTRQYITPKNGEIVITNDPYTGNTRLCDLMFISPVYGRQQANELRYYLVFQLSLQDLLNKPLTRVFESVEDEGYRIPPILLEEKGVINSALIDYLCQSGISRDELLGYVTTIKNSLRDAGQQMTEVEQELGRDTLNSRIDYLNKYSEKSMRKALHTVPDGDYVAHDFLDNDGIDKNSVRIQAKLTVHGENLGVSFSGSSKQTKGPFNCNYSLTLGAAFWVLRSLAKNDIPINSGAFKAFSIEAPNGTIVNPQYPAPLLGGYYETTTRIVDVLFMTLGKALPLETPAVSGGSTSITMIQANNRLFVQTLGCGSGASPTFDGVSGVKPCLHNLRTTSIERVERLFGLQVLQNRLRDSSGGNGKHDGGAGLSRSYKVVNPINVLFLADRQSFKPHGSYGGVSGSTLEIDILRNNEKIKFQGEKKLMNLQVGDVLVINSPGGGGWGKPEEPEAD